MNKAIIGAGGFGREVYASLDRIDKISCVFFVDDSYYNNEPNTLPLSKFDPKKYEVVVAIGDPKARFEMVQKLPKETQYFTFIHRSAQILGNDVTIGRGSIICPGVILTCNIQIGEHAHLNLNTTIGHDCSIGDYFTTAPGVNISGNCKIHNQVYFGTNSSSKQKVTICNSVTIGLNAGVVKDINEPGTYIGTPAKRL